jgi:hypothetical protein
MPKKSKSKAAMRKIALEAGAGILTAAALTAGAAYLLSDKKRQAKAKAWAQKTRREVAANVRRARKLSETEYKRIVDTAVKRYGGLSTANKAELTKVSQDLKNEWQRLQRMAKPARSGSRRRAARRTTHKKK